MKKFNQEELEEEEMKNLFNEAMEEVTNVSDEDYEEELNDIYGEVEICGISYSAGRALKEVDPIAFGCGKSEFEAQKEEDFNDENDIEDFREQALINLDMEEE